MKNILFILTALFSLNGFASTEYSPDSTVKYIYSYTERGAGDFVVVLNSNSSNCSSGYWTNKDDPGFSVSVSMLIAAYQAKSTVRLQANPDRRWSESETGAYCHLDYVSYR